MDGNRVDYKLRGDNGRIFLSRDHEVIVSGPADTGKTWACCLKLHEVCASNPGAQVSVVRKTYNSLVGTVVKTFARVTKGRGVRALGGEFPSRFIYPNGSVVWLAGMDNPDRALSSERDAIYVNQAEELAESDWEVLATRCSGRAAVVANPQIFGDCNPGGSRHWIRRRKSLRLLRVTHRDNPTIYDDNGNVTLGGRSRLAVLDNLTGVRRKRLRDGVWATAEGAVYEMFDPAIHVMVRSRDEMKRWLMTVDVGFTNPAVTLDIGEDEDGRWHCFREFYERGVIPENHTAQIKAWHEEGRQAGRLTEMVVVDAAAAGFIASLIGMGVPAVAGKGTILGKAGSGGIQAIQNRLKVQGDGRPRYTLDPGCVNHQNEFESYVWKPEKDVPEKENDHTMDALRYLEDQASEPTGSFDSAEQIDTAPRSEFAGALGESRIAPDDFRL